MDVAKIKLVIDTTKSFCPKLPDEIWEKMFLYLENDLSAMVNLAGASRQLCNISREPCILGFHLCRIALFIIGASDIAEETRITAEKFMKSEASKKIKVLLLEE